MLQNQQPLSRIALHEFSHDSIFRLVVWCEHLRVVDVTRFLHPLRFWLLRFASTARRLISS